MRRTEIYHQSTPETVWGHYGFSEAQVAGGDFNAQMFNSFLDGTKSALEMAAVSNGCDLTPPADGLAFPPCGVDDLPHILRPAADGGILTRKATVDVVSSSSATADPSSATCAAASTSSSRRRRTTCATASRSTG